MTAISTAILVHGAWADGSCWAKVIPLLAAKGLEVTAVQLPLTGFEADVAAVRRAIALAGGDVVLVGHSYAGAVIGRSPAWSISTPSRRMLASRSVRCSPSSMPPPSMRRSDPTRKAFSN